MELEIYRASLKDQSKLEMPNVVQHWRLSFSQTAHSKLEESSLVVTRTRVAPKQRITVHIYSSQISSSSESLRYDNGAIQIIMFD